MRPILFVLFAALSWPCAAQQLWPDLSSLPKAAGGGEKDAALIVGVENYASLEHVPGALQNAQDWQAYLTKTLKVPSDRVDLLLDDKATLEMMRQSAILRAADAKPGGTLWLVFIGRGAVSKDAQDGLLVGFDAEPRAYSIYARSLAVNELLGLLAEGKQSKTVALLDASFSSRTASGQSLVSDLQPMDNRTILLSAAKPDQSAGPLPDSGKARPAFSYLALGALRGWAAEEDGKVTARGLVDFAAKALKLAKDRTQTPELAGEQGGAVLAIGREPPPNLAKIDRDWAKKSASPAAPKPARTEPEKPAVKVSLGIAGIQWVRLSSGTFMMGNGNNNLPFGIIASPGHKVALAGFEIAKTEVSNRQYRECVATGICTPAADYGEIFWKDDQPIVGVSWQQARAFSAWVGGRLPTEAEWEYAARGAGEDREYPWGPEGPTCERAVFDDEGPGCGRNAPWPVCSKPAGNTPQGLCDMSGNVWEFVQDAVNRSYAGAPADGSAWESGDAKSRIVRGGAWNGFAYETWFRGTGVISGDSSIGFRPVRPAP